MNDNKKNKPDKGLVNRLRSDNEDKVLLAIQDLRVKGNSSYIPELLNLLANTNHEGIYRELSRLLNDIKDSSVIPYLIDGIKDKKYSGIRNTLVSACWQTGMDFSENLDIFVDLFLLEDYPTALEAFSVIEQSVEQLSSNELEKHRNKLISGINTIAEDKKPLLRELINLLQ